MDHPGVVIPQPSGRLLHPAGILRPQRLRSPVSRGLGDTRCHPKRLRRCPNPLRRWQWRARPCRCFWRRVRGGCRCGAKRRQIRWVYVLAILVPQEPRANPPRRAPTNPRFIVAIRAIIVVHPGRTPARSWWGDSSGTDAVRVTIHLPRHGPTAEDPNPTTILNDPRGPVPRARTVRDRVGRPTDIHIQVLRRRRICDHRTAIVRSTYRTREEMTRLTQATCRPESQRRSALGDRKEPCAFAQRDGGRPRIRTVIKLLIRKDSVPRSRAPEAPMNLLPGRHGKPAAPRRSRVRGLDQLIRRNPRVHIHFIREIACRPTTRR